MKKLVFISFLFYSELFFLPLMALTLFDDISFLSFLFM